MRLWALGLRLLSQIRAQVLRAFVLAGFAWLSSNLEELKVNLWDYKGMPFLKKVNVAPCLVCGPPPPPLSSRGGGWDPDYTARGLI